MYENKTAYSGPFFQLCDSQNRTVLLLGYIQRESSNNGQVEVDQEGFFTDVLNYHHYYFPFNRSSEWSTWRLTGYIQQMTEDGLYWGNYTLQIDNETITSFRSDSIIPEGMVYNITNEEVEPIAYCNIYPLPQTGVMIIPTTSNTNGIHYNLLSNKVSTARYNQAIPSYVENFLYGYANPVPMSITSTSISTPTPSVTLTQTTTSTPTSTPSVPEFPTLIILALFAVATLLSIMLIRKDSKKTLQ